MPSPDEIAAKARRDKRFFITVLTIVALTVLWSMGEIRRNEREREQHLPEDIPEISPSPTSSGPRIIHTKEKGRVLYGNLNETIGITPPGFKK